MKLTIYQIDAFAEKVFQGNPAAVVPLDEWLPDDVLLNIALENNLSETAFFVSEGDGYRIRWFTPVSEVDLCGHATIASAYVLFNILNYENPQIRFLSRSGELTVVRDADLFQLNFPVAKIQQVDIAGIVEKALGKVPAEVWSSEDLIVVFESQSEIEAITPNFPLLKTINVRGVIVTAKGDDADFVCRFFAPRYGIDEDPVTGSAYCELMPYWANKLNKSVLHAKQLSKRSGDIWCELVGDRVLISGKAVHYMTGEITI